MMILTHTSHLQRSNRGFTMVEALVGLVILALGLLSLARFHTSLIEGSGLTKARTAAINYGQDKMDELRNLIEKDDFIDTSVTPYTPGSIIANGADVVTPIGNERFTRRWTVLSAPTLPSHAEQADLEVKVSWPDAEGNTQEIYLVSKIAWMDPADSSPSTTSATSIPFTIPFPSGNATVGDGVATLDTTGLTPTVNDDFNSDGTGDGTRTVTDTDGVHYILGAGDVILLQSSNVFTTIRGVIARDTAASPGIQTTQAIFAAMDVVASDAGHCVFPLIYDPATPANDNEPETTGLVDIARYTCYVAEGWYGSVGVFNQDANDDVCPGIARSYRGISYSLDGTTIVGIFGLTVATAQAEDDFVVTKLSGVDTCSTIPLPAGVTDTNTNGSPGPLEGAQVIVATQIGKITIRGAVTIDTTSSPAAGSTFAGLTVVSASTNGGSGTCTSVADTGSGYGVFTCTVDHGWAGTITLTADDTSDKVCTGGIGTIGSAAISHSAEQSNLTGEDFDIVEGSGVIACP